MWFYLFLLGRQKSFNKKSGLAIMCVRFPRTTDDAAHGEEAYALDEQGRSEIRAISALFFLLFSLSFGAIGSGMSSTSTTSFGRFGPGTSITGVVEVGTVAAPSFDLDSSFACANRSPSFTTAHRKSNQIFKLLLTITIL